VAKAVPEEVDRDGEDEQRNPRHQDRPRMALKSPGPSDVDEVAQFRQKEVACVESDELEGRENLSYHTKVQRNLNEHWRERVRQDMPSMIRASDAPAARAASTNFSSFTESDCARTSRAYGGHHKMRRIIFIVRKSRFCRANATAMAKTRNGIE